MYVFIRKWVSGHLIIHEFGQLPFFFLSEHRFRFWFLLFDHRLLSQLNSFLKLIRSKGPLADSCIDTYTDNG
jgi:hypothetical protein